MGKIIITIGRQYGSGGREVGEKLAERLSIPCYDKLIIDEISKESNITPDLVEKIEENQRETLNFMIFNTYYSGSAFAPTESISTKVHTARVTAIKELAKKGSCVIIGRAADSVLEEEDHILNFFISAKYEERVKRIMERNGITDEKEAEKKINQTDKQRARFYNNNTDKKWGDSSSYSLCIDSSVIGIDKTVDALERYVRAYMDEFKIESLD